MNLELLLRPTQSLRAAFCERLEWIAKPLYVNLLKRKSVAWGHTKATLQSFEPGTLGHDIYRFLHSNGLEIIPKLEVHDVFHVLFEMEPNVPDEVRLQALLLGNGRSSLYTWCSVVIGYTLFPEYYADFKAAYRKGKRCRRCVHWRFEYLLQERTQDLRAFILCQPISTDAHLV